MRPANFNTCTVRDKYGKKTVHTRACKFFIDLGSPLFILAAPNLYSERQCPADAFYCFKCEPHDLCLADLESFYHSFSKSIDTHNLLTLKTYLRVKLSFPKSCTFFATCYIHQKYMQVCLKFLYCKFVEK